MAEKLATRQAIRKHCVMCSGGSALEVKNCTVKKCYLWPFRHGRGWEDPDTGKIKKKVISEKQKEQAKENIKKLHSKSKSGK